MPTLKPVIQLTKAQWKKLLERMVMRGEEAPLIEESAVKGGSRWIPDKPGLNPFYGSPRTETRTPSVVDEIMQGQPPTEVVRSRLRMQQEGIPLSEPSMIPKDFPYAEAKMKYMENPWSPENPGGYVPVDIGTPSYKRLRTVPPGSAEDMSGAQQAGLAYEKVRYKPIRSQLERKVAKVAPEETPQVSLPEIIQTGVLLERMWKTMGGKRSVSGQLWNQLRLSAPGRNKVADTKDYFVRCGLRWREDPVKFSKNNPREAKLLNAMWEEIEKEVAGAPTP